MARVEVDLKERRVERKAWRSDRKFTRWEGEFVRDTCCQTVSKQLLAVKLTAVWGSVNNLRRHFEACIVEGADYRISLENKDRKETRSDGDSKLYESGGEKEGRDCMCGLGPDTLDSRCLKRRCCLDMKQEGATRGGKQGYTYPHAQMDNSRS